MSDAPTWKTEDGLEWSLWIVDTPQAFGIESTMDCPLVPDAAYRVPDEVLAKYGWKRVDADD